MRPTVVICNRLNYITEDVDDHTVYITPCSKKPPTHDTTVCYSSVASSFGQVWSEDCLQHWRIHWQGIVDEDILEDHLMLDCIKNPQVCQTIFESKTQWDKRAVNSDVTVIQVEYHWQWCGTAWPILCWCAVKKLLTHSLQNIWNCSKTQI